MLALVREDWSAEAEAALQVSAGEDMAWIRDEVKRGIAALYRCEDQGRLDGRTVLRLDETELVIVLGEGRNSRKWIPVIEQYAKKIGAKKLRTHIKRQGLKRIYERAGWGQLEVVMERIL